MNPPRSTRPWRHPCGQFHSHADNFIIAGKLLVVGSDDVVSFRRWYRFNKVLPGLRKNTCRPSVKEPVNVLVATEKNSTQYQSQYRFRVGLGIGQCKRGTPRTAEHNPALDFQELANFLKIGDQVPGSIILETCMGSRFSATALVKKYDAIGLGVEEAAMPGLAGAAWSAM